MAKKSHEPFKSAFCWSVKEGRRSPTSRRRRKEGGKKERGMGGVVEK